MDVSSLREQAHEQGREKEQEQGQGQGQERESEGRLTEPSQSPNKLTSKTQNQTMTPTNQQNENLKTRDKDNEKILNVDMNFTKNQEKGDQSEGENEEEEEEEQEEENEGDEDEAAEMYFSEEDTIPTGGIYPRKYYKILHVGNQVYKKGDSVVLDTKESASSVGSIKGEFFAQVLCFFLNHKKLMQMQVRWLIPASFSEKKKTKLGNPMPTAFAFGTSEKNPQSVNSIVQKITNTNVNDHVNIAEGQWEKERRKKKKKDKEKKRLERINAQKEIKQSRSHESSQGFNHSSDSDRESKQKRGSLSFSPYEEHYNFDPQNKKARIEQHNLIPHHYLDNIRSIAHRSTPQSENRIPIDLSPNLNPLINSSNLSSTFTPSPNNAQNSPSPSPKDPNQVLEPKSTLPFTRNFNGESNSTSNRTQSSSSTSIPPTQKSNIQRVPKKNGEYIRMDPNLLCLISQNPTLRADIIEISNNFDKKGDLWTSPIQGFLESLLLCFDSLDRLQVGIKRVPPQGNLMVLDLLSPVTVDESSYKNFVTWIQLLKNSK